MTNNSTDERCLIKGFDIVTGLKYTLAFGCTDGLK